MSRFFLSGGLFFTMAAVFFVIAFVSENSRNFVALGALWLILGIVAAVRQRG
jgi:hypothetical protein